MSPKTEEKTIFGGLAKKLILYILLFSSCITLIGTSLQLYLDYARDIDAIETAMDQIEKSHRNPIISNLWVSDIEQLKIQLQGVLDLPEMQYLEIIADGETVISLGVPTGDKVIARSFPLSYSFRGKDIELGTLHVSANLERVYRRLFDKVFIILITQGIKTFLVSFFIFFLFYTLVGRHLEKLAHSTQKLTLDNLDTEISLTRKKGKNSPADELDTVVNAINDMRINLVRDIEAREKAEKDLQKSEEQFHQLSEISPVGIFITDADGKTVYWNDKLCKITGMSREDGAGVGWADGIHPEDRERVFNEWYASTGSRANFNSEYRFIDRSGNVTWTIGQAIPIVNSSGDTTGFIGTITDITELKTAEEELRKEIEFTKTALDAQQDTFFLFDPITGKALRWNQSFKIISGYSDEEISRLPAPDSYYSKEDLERAAILFRRIEKTGMPTIRMELICKNGRKIPFEYIISYIKNKDGSPKYFISIGRNITERILAEEEFTKNHERLEQMVDERTEKLKMTINLMAGRENRMAELKKVIEILSEQIKEAGMTPSVDDPLMKTDED